MPVQTKKKANAKAEAKIAMYTCITAKGSIL